MVDHWDGVGCHIAVGGRSELVRATCEALVALGYVPTVQDEPLRTPNVDVSVICCNDRPHWSTSIEQLRLHGDLHAIVLVGHASPCPACIGALDAGADAWIPEVPTSSYEVHLKYTVRGIVRRARGRWETTVAGVRLQPADCVAHFGTRSVSMRPKEFALLAYLAARPGTWISEQRLREDALDIRQKHETPLVRVHLTSLRKSLGAFAQCIQSRRGLGYRFLAPSESEP